MKKELIAHKDPKSPISEVFRTLRTNIQFMNTSKKMKTLLVTSTSPGEGKSWVSSNLAVTFAQAGKRVILVDADMRKGRQYTIFGVLPKPGLSNYLSGINEYDNQEDPKDIEEYIQKTEVANLCLMSAGNIPPNPAELLMSARMIKLIEELKELSDIIIIDGTPCDLVTDSVILSRIVDSTVIVTAHESTKRDAMERVVTSIQRGGGKIAGVIINKIPISTKKYEQSYYYGSTNGRNAGRKKNTGRGTYSINHPTNSKFSRASSLNNTKNIKKIDNMEDTIVKMYEQRNNQECERNKEDKPKFSTKKVQTSYEKSNNILKEINDYIDKEKKKLGDF